MTDAEKILMNGLKNEVFRLQQYIAVLRTSNVTHYCATCETLARENELLVRERDIAKDGLRELRSPIARPPRGYA